MGSTTADRLWCRQCHRFLPSLDEVLFVWRRDDPGHAWTVCRPSAFAPCFRGLGPASIYGIASPDSLPPGVSL